MWAIAIFTLTYLGVAIGRIPYLLLDRTGIALLGAIAMVVGGSVALDRAVASIDLPTIILLYALMIVSAQLRLGGFYTRVAQAHRRAVRASADLFADLHDASARCSRPCWPTTSSAWPSPRCWPMR